MMKAEIKRCYRYLDLPFNATKDDVELRQKMMIKVTRAKAISKGKSYNKRIEKINFSALTLLNFIDEQGIQQPETFSFRPSAEHIYGELFTLLIVMILCATTFFLLV